MGNSFDDDGEFCAGDIGTVVGGGSVCGDCGGVSTGSAFQKSYDVLTP